MISVLMSVYNESLSELSTAIDSILSQTFEDFEFIIVCDNPQNSEIIGLIKKYESVDKRVSLIINEKNIGLALSLNKAASYATGEYLFRMDADDISYPNRMYEQYREMTENNLDLVCSGYDIINDKSQIIESNVGYSQDETLRSSIPYKVSIHHPTVMMRKSFFDMVGGYRNFICAQDYDLWLRMWYANARMKNMHKTLLKYRIREDSVTSQKRFIQKLTVDYVKNLFLQKLKSGCDNYSYSGYLNYLKEKGAYEEKKNKKFLEEHSLLLRANSFIQQGSLIKGYFMRACVFFRSESFRRSYLVKLKTKVLVKLFSAKMEL